MGELQVENIRLPSGYTIVVRLHRSASPDAETLFFLHGLGGYGQQWESVLQLLNRDVNVIVPDLLGHGQSMKPHQQILYTIDALFSDVVFIFERFATAKNTIVAHSLSGVFAMLLAQRFVDQIDKLILVSPLPCMPAPCPAIYHLPVFMLKILRPMLQTAFEKAAYTAKTSPDLLLRERLAAKQNDLFVIRSIVTDFPHIPSIDANQLTVPLQLILGASDRLVPPTHSKAYYQHILHYQCDMLPGIGHMALLEQPASIAKYLQ